MDGAHLLITVLLVEDDAGDAFLIREFLSGRPDIESVRHETHLGKALEVCALEVFDVVLLDLNLPDAEGMETVSSLRSAVSVPIIVLTGQDDLETGVAALRHGAQDYLVKHHFGEETLWRSIRYTLERHRLQLEMEHYRRNLAAIFKGIPDAIVTVDHARRIVECNKAFERLASAPREKMIGVPLREAAQELPPSCMRTIDRSLDEERDVLESRIAFRSHGADRAFALSTTRFDDPNDERRGTTCILRDITRMADLEKRVRDRTGLERIKGHSPAMQDVYELLEHLRGLETTVLITGESGTGKELIADALHLGSPRGDKQLVKINCTALSENLLESELFGHVRGAFTDAVRDRKGRIELAQGGTLFLDEVGDLPQSVQVKLLRFLESREYERLGESETRKADVRLLAATNTDLTDAVAKGRFREDLYYRLKVMIVQLPPLRHRTVDIPLLSTHFLEELGVSMGKRIDGVSSEVLGILMAHSWPGNVRELRHAMEHAVILCQGGTILPFHLPSDLISPETAHAHTHQRTAQASTDRTKPDREAVLAALDQARWNKTQAAKVLGIGRRTLYAWLERLQIA